MHAPRHLRDTRCSPVSGFVIDGFENSIESKNHPAATVATAMIGNNRQMVTVGGERSPETTIISKLISFIIPCANRRTDPHLRGFRFRRGWRRVWDQSDGIRDFKLHPELQPRWSSKRSCSKKLKFSLILSRSAEMTIAISIRRY